MQEDTTASATGRRPLDQLLVPWLVVASRSRANARLARGCRRSLSRTHVSRGGAVHWETSAVGWMPDGSCVWRSRCVDSRRSFPGTACLMVVRALRRSNAALRANCTIFASSPDFNARVRARRTLRVIQLVCATSGRGYGSVARCFPLNARLGSQLEVLPEAQPSLTFPFPSRCHRRVAVLARFTGDCDATVIVRRRTSLQRTSTLHRNVAPLRPTRAAPRPHRLNPSRAVLSSERSEREGVRCCLRPSPPQPRVRIRGSG